MSTRGRSTHRATGKDSLPMTTKVDRKTTREPIRRDPDASRQRILAAATEVFAAQGLDGARVDDIAERSDINKRMLYHYFGSKDELFAAVLYALYEDICGQSAALDLHADPPLEAINRLVDFAVDFYLDNPHAITLLNDENLHKARHLAKSGRVRAIHKPFEEMIDAVLKRGAASGELNSGLNAAELYITIVGLIYYYLSNGHTLSLVYGRDLYSPKELRARRQHMHDVITRFVAAPPAASRNGK